MTDGASMQDRTSTMSLRCRLTLVGFGHADERPSMGPQTSNVILDKSEPGRVGPGEPGRHAPARNDQRDIPFLSVSRRSCAILAAIVALAGARAAALDTVDVAGTSAPRGRTRLSGRVVDYTGRQLVLELPGGRRQEIPGDRVLDVKTDYEPQQVEGDRLLGQGQYGAALELYQRAIAAEKRPWVKRLILARMVWSFQGLAQKEPEQAQRAGEAFLALVQSDPSTPYFDCIPLAWIPAQPPPLLEQTAQGWLARDAREAPAAVLLGASHLLPTAKRPEALAKLRRLATNPDKRIALLALAQGWRAAVNPGDDQLEGWERAIGQMPEPLRAGPYFALGRGHLQRQRWEDAALALMRVPILYPQHRELAARALLESARALERLARPKEAARLYREVLNSYAGASPAVEARSRLKEMTAGDG